MSASAWWIYDILVLGVSIYVIISNARRGLAKVLVLSIGYAVVTIAAGILASVGAPNLYRSVAAETNITNFETANMHMDFAQLLADSVQNGNYGAVLDEKELKRRIMNANNRDFTESLYEYVCKASRSDTIDKTQFSSSLMNVFIRKYGEELDSRLPHYVRMNFENKVRANPSLMNQTIANFYNPSMDTTECARTEEALFGEESTIEVLQIFLFLILFSVLMVVVALISSMTQRSIFINISRGAEHTLGGLIGIFEAGAMLILLTVLIRLIILLSGGGGRYFNENEIHASIIFSFLYEHLQMLI
ncbi:MAG: hypothetical protein MJ065_02000 [Oscillospiraceae bacterium]|nr:hypothetical protein [Oscillospiraceae bacterium]